MERPLGKSRLTPTRNRDFEQERIEIGLAKLVKHLLFPVRSTNECADGVAPTADILTATYPLKPLVRCVSVKRLVRMGCVAPT